MNGIEFNSEHAIPRFVEIDDDNNVELFIIEDTGTGIERYLFYENTCGCPSGVNQFRCAQSVLNLSGSPILPGLYQAIEEINSNGTVASGMTVDYRAGNGILLESDFDVVLGAKFSADIETCNTPFAPNPAEETLFLNGNNVIVQPVSQGVYNVLVNATATEEVAIRLFDIKGVEQTAVTKTTKLLESGQHILLESGQLPTGAYFLSVQTEDGEYKERIVVQRE